MANYSFTTSRNPNMTESEVTAGTNAPSAGDVEVRVSTTNGITRDELELAMDRIWYFITSGQHSNILL